MPPKRAPTATPTSSASRSSAAARSSGPPARQQEPGTVGSALRNTYDMLTAQENRSVLKAVGFAGVSEYSCFATRGRRGRGKEAPGRRIRKAGEKYQRRNGSGRICKKRRVKQEVVHGRRKTLQKSNDAPNTMLQNQYLGQRSITSHCNCQNLHEDFTSTR